MAMQRRTRARVILHKNIPDWLRHIAETDKRGRLVNKNEMKIISVMYTCGMVTNNLSTSLRIHSLFIYSIFPSIFTNTGFILKDIYLFVKIASRTRANYLPKAISLPRQSI
ncbi:hypothetical protein X777_05880 [Ooceraea biroi]|uniref:Uncharacterized protein n=1 Tax=Ooceraea biroi TaxID=2015173 RepID=A0A026WEE0_OOCBI|nr:hypothetical protein X777_05880 [Ooceraea biroi]